MRFDGIGNNHSADVHHVTNCMHDHTRFEKKEGRAAMSASPASNTQAQTSEVRQEEPFSLSAWLEKTFGDGKRLLRRLWGSDEWSRAGEAGDKSGAAQISAGIREDGEDGGRSAGTGTVHAPQIAAAATAVQPPRTLTDNPYFSAVEDTGRRQETLWQKIRVKFGNVAGQLAGHLPGKFFGFQAKNSFQAKQERPKEDLRKLSKYRKDEAVIDCILTDDSYLLDSYNKKGEYRKLSTKNK